jgi:HNH endonuclease
MTPKNVAPLTETLLLNVTGRCRPRGRGQSSWFGHYMPAPLCIFCDKRIGANTKPEHILLSALGGRKKTRDVECSSCNEAFGNNIDKVVADQVAILRNMLHLESGRGNLPRRLRKVDASGDTVDIEGDGTIKPVVKPITFTSLGEGKFGINVTAGSFEEIAKYIPHIATKLKGSEEQVLQRLTTADAKIVSKRRGPIRHDFTFGGPLAIRSFVKSALVLWSTLVGTDEVKSVTYEGSTSRSPSTLPSPAAGRPR